jgi:hypothetical protein
MKRIPPPLWSIYHNEKPRVRKSPQPKQLELWKPGELPLSYWRDGQAAFDDSREENKIGKSRPVGKF